MSVTYPLTNPTTAPTLASMTTGGLAGLIAAIAPANSLPATATRWLNGSAYSLSDAYLLADRSITNYTTAQPVDLAALDADLDGVQAAYAAVVLAIAEARTVIAANPGSLALVVGGVSTSVGAGAELLRVWPSGS